MIEAVHLTKRYGDVTAVDDLSFQIKPGQVTGFLGPNGAGKTTTMRMILGLDAPDHRFGHHQRPGLPRPPRPAHGGRRPARRQSRPRRAQRLQPPPVLAASNGLPDSRVDEVLRIVGLRDVARRRAGGFSLGMGQRLGIAAALLGDPGILMFDEPVNGLDPEGILWVRNFMRELAAEGRTVLVSSHLMSEMALTADHLIVIGRGRLLAAVGGAGVHRPERRPVGARCAAATTRPSPSASPGSAARSGRSPGAGSTSPGSTRRDRRRDAAFNAGIIVSELTPQQASLEEAFMEMTQDSVEYTSEKAGAMSTTLIPARRPEPGAGPRPPPGHLRRSFAPSGSS